MQSQALITFDDLTDDNLKNEIGGELTASDFINLARTSTRLLRVFNAEFKAASALFRVAFEHAAFGEWRDVDRLLILFPELLLWRATIQHRGRFRFDNCFLWQIALMNEEEKNVFPMLIKHFARLPGGLLQMLQQMEEVFPKGERAKLGFDLEKAKQLLDEAHAAIIKDQIVGREDMTKMSEATNIALNAYYAYIYPKPSDKFSRGLLVDIRIFAYAIRKYHDTYHDFKTWNQRQFYCVKLWDDFLLRLPTGYLKELLRSKTDYSKTAIVDGCKLKSGVSVLPAGANNELVLGRDYIDGSGDVKSGLRKISPYEIKTHSSMPARYFYEVTNLGLFKADDFKKAMRELQSQIASAQVKVEEIEEIEEAAKKAECCGQFRKSVCGIL